MLSPRPVHYLALVFGIGVSACVGFDVAEAARRIASVPILRPVAVVTQVSEDGKTFSTRVVINNQGIDDAPGPFDVKLTLTPLTSASGGAETTITIPAGTTIQGTAATAGAGGTLTTPVIVPAYPWKQGDQYNWTVQVDPNGTYKGGVATKFQLWGYSGQALAPCATYTPPCKM
jgi:hypothetical protein